VSPGPRREASAGAPRRGGLEQRHRTPAALACLLLVFGGIAASGCGDDEGEPGTTTPTVESATPTGASGPTGRAGVKGGRPQSDKGDTDLDDGAVSPPPEVDPDAVEEPVDSPENDLPPEPGSAEEAFEKHCEENPEACG
jgi:hypothetical protein